jgi:hypothetical protein
LTSKELIIAADAYSMGIAVGITPWRQAARDLAFAPNPCHFELPRTASRASIWRSGAARDVTGTPGGTGAPAAKG